MSDLLNRIENLLTQASFSGGTEGFDCEQELADASNRIFELEQQLENADTFSGLLSSECMELKDKIKELEKQLVDKQSIIDKAYHVARFSQFLNRREIQSILYSASTIGGE